MRPTIKLGRFWGLNIGLHYSWFFIAWLMVMSLTGEFGARHPGWGPAVIWTSAVITAILFFFSLLLHEAAHSIVARSRGTPVRGIVLFALGGVSQIEKESADAKTEFWMAIAGPATSAGLGILCLGLAGLPTSTSSQTPWLAVLGWLGYINLGLAMFNMIPGYPLDGGRILRAAVWWITGNVDRATFIAAGFGHLIAWIFIGVGILRFFKGEGFNGLWLAFIGWFLLQAARGRVAEPHV